MMSWPYYHTLVTSDNIVIVIVSQSYDHIKYGRRFKK